MKHIALFTFTFCLHLSLLAAVPCPWTVEMTRAKPATFEYYQGETIDFKATLMASGKPFESPSNYSFFWQTNGMGNLYWEAPQQGGAGVPPAQSNVLFATWLPSYDVGARVYKCFIGSPSNNYHTAFQLRLMPSPGATPNELPLPTPVIDFSKVTVLNPPWSGGGGGGVDTNAVERIANRAVETNAVTVGLSSSVSGLQSSKADKSTTYTKAETDEMLAGKADGYFDEDMPGRFAVILDDGNTVGRSEYDIDTTVQRITDAENDISTLSSDIDAVIDEVENVKVDYAKKPSSPNAGNIAFLDENGDLEDGGIAKDDVATLGSSFFGINGDFDGDVHAGGWLSSDMEVKIVDRNGETIHSLAAKADRSMISATDPTFSNEVAEVAKTVTPTPTGTLRLFDPVLNRWVILKSVNMNLTLEVE